MNSFHCAPHDHLELGKPLFNFSFCNDWIHFLYQSDSLTVTWKDGTNHQHFIEVEVADALKDLLQKWLDFTELLSNRHDFEQVLICHEE